MCGGLVRRMSSWSHHMTKGRHSEGFGTASRELGAHVQNCPAAVIGAWCRILIKGAPFFDGIIIVGRCLPSQGN